MSGQGGRYQRSMGGMTGAMIVVVLAVIAFVAFRALLSDAPENDPAPIGDYREAVERAEAAGIDAVHPVRLPAGWTVTSIHVAAGDRPEWGMGVLTDDGAFIGLRQEDTDVEDLVGTYIDEEAVEGDEVELEGELPGPWLTWRDQGGDLGFSTTWRDQTLLVYGSAAREDVEELVSLLRR